MRIFSGSREKQESVATEEASAIIVEVGSNATTTTSTGQVLGEREEAENENHSRGLIVGIVTILIITFTISLRRKKYEN